LIWLRIGIIGKSLEYGIELPGSISHGVSWLVSNGTVAWKSKGSGKILS
jgi:hypothetical protein